MSVKRTGRAEYRRYILQNVSEIWIRLRANLTAQPHLYFGAVAAAEHRSVLNKAYVNALTHGGKRHAGARYSAAAYNHVVQRFILSGGNARYLAAKFLGIFRNIVFIGCKKHRVAPAVKARKVAQRHSVRLPAFKLHSARILPIPLFAVCAEGIFKAVIVYHKFKGACGCSAFPHGGPIAGAHICVPLSAFGQFYVCNGVCHRGAQTVRHNVRRAHYIHRLLINYPAAQIFKTFSFGKKPAHFKHPDSSFFTAD